MKRLTVITGILLGIGLTTSILLLPTEDTVSQDISSEAMSASKLAVATYANNKISTTTTGEFISMSQTIAKTGSVAPFDADTFVKPSDEELKQRLSKIEYKVTQHEGTERPFSNALHDEKRVGLYVDIVSGEPLFASVDKFDSRTGWPSFDRPIAEGVVVEKVDRSLFGVRTEIRSSVADSHLGHVFNDGPATTGNRYCMNSAAMRFIPLEQMAASGYGDYIERVSGVSS